MLSEIKQKKLRDYFLEAPIKRGIMLCGHGSRSVPAVHEFSGLVNKLKNLLPYIPIEYGYLEFAKPIINEGIEKLRKEGVREIIAIPAMLFAAGHAKNDIPSVLNRYMAEHSEIKIQYSRELGIDNLMIKAASERINEAINESNVAQDKHNTMLLVVGRGASDPDANSNVTKVTRLLWEGLGFGWAETAYSGVTFPLVGPALEKIINVGYKRIIIFPYFLFTGILVDRIYQSVELIASKYKDIEFIKASYLNDHPKVVETFCDRIINVIDGEINMNCQLCKYREQVLGFEDEVGLAQESHHHHVEGGAHDHDHTHSHHHPYPHSKHPLGPVTLKK
jgi:sirohydrochlorin cobaltochelatase